MEDEFFISEYLGETRTAMNCILKQRFSDFIVNEITPQGEITQVCTDASAGQAEDKRAVEFREIPAPLCLSTEDVKQVESVLEEPRKVVNIPVQGMDKDTRKSIHCWIRNRYRSKLNSKTIAEGGSIEVSLTADHRKRKTWPEQRPDYVHFTLSKENMDSHHAISLLAKFIGVKVGNVGICGLKDRRAVTSQRVSLYRIEAARVLALNPRLRNMRCSHVKYNAQPCSLGQLQGNQFRIVLRGVSESSAEIDSRLAEFRKGFINYFGTQRFGSIGSATAQVGLAILQGNYAQAIEAILRPRTNQAQCSVSAALHEWNTSHDATTAVSLLHGGARWSVEGQVLTALSKASNNYQAALLSVPRSTRSLYVHAYQSLVWNKMVSRRIRELGNEVVQGDIDSSGKTVEGKDMSQVALPLPSAHMVLPNNQVRDWYEECLAEDGVTTDMFAALETHFAVGEVLRLVVVVPGHVECRLVQYRSNDQALQPDLEGHCDLVQEGAMQEGAVQEGAVQEGAVGEGAVQEGAVQEGAVQEGAVQEDAVQEGAVQEGAVQEGAVQEGAVQERAVQERAVQERAVQEGAVQEDAVQEGAVQEGAVQGATLQAVLISFSLPPGSYATVALRQFTRRDMGKTAQTTAQ